MKDTTNLKNLSTGNKSCLEEPRRSLLFWAVPKLKIGNFPVEIESLRKFVPVGHDNKRIYTLQPLLSSSDNVIRINTASSEGPQAKSA